MVVLETYDLNNQITKAARTGKKLIDYFISNIPANIILHSDVLLCPTISDHDAPYIIANMPVNKFQTKYKYKRNLKNFELKKYVQDFKTLPKSLVYSFDNPNDQLDTLDKLILNEINEHAPLTRTKFMRPTAPWIKDFEIKKLEKEKDHWRHEAHSKQALQSWEQFREIWDKIKKVINKKKTSFFKKVFQSKNKNDIWKIIHRIVILNSKTVKVDPKKLNEFFNKTAERLINQTDNATIRSYVSSLKNKSNSFKLRLVTPTEVNKCIKTVRNDCSTGYNNIPVSLIKLVAAYLESPLTFIINNFIVASAFPGKVYGESLALALFQKL